MMIAACQKMGLSALVLVAGLRTIVAMKYHGLSVIRVH